jgi:hypothetical protein
VSTPSHFRSKILHALEVEPGSALDGEDLLAACGLEPCESDLDAASAYGDALASLEMLGEVVYTGGVWRRAAPRTRRYRSEPRQW